MTTDGLGLYVHIPFCKRKCGYCDFCSFDFLSQTERHEYLLRLFEEVSSYKREEKLFLDTLYFGGGTPSLLTADEFLLITSKIKSNFNLSENLEFTLEVNPKTLTPEKVACYKECGVNRISIGLQSIHKNEQKMLGRIHNLDDFLFSYNMIVESEIDNVSIDLMYGIPEQTLDSFKKSLELAVSLSPKHISSYGLIVEEGTPFYKMADRLPLPSEDEEADMYRLMCEFLASHGYGHYEISNFAIQGYESRHNLKYWKAEEYIGVGISAHSNFDGMRYGNVSVLSDYLADSYKEKRVVEITDQNTRAFEYAMLHLRLADGFSLSEYKSLFGTDFLSARADTAKRYIDSGLLRICGDRIFLTEQGFYLSNTILCDLL